MLDSAAGRGRGSAHPKTSRSGLTSVMLHRFANIRRLRQITVMLMGVTREEILGGLERPLPILC